MNDPKDTHARIAARAYQLWEAEGRPHGRDSEHWKKAEAELTTAPAAATPTVTAKPVAAAAPVKRPTIFRGRKPGPAPAQTTR